MLPRSSQRYQTSRDTDSIGRRIRGFVLFLVLLFVVYEGVTTLLVATVEQESVAMEPTLEVGDRLFTLPPAYGPRMALFGWTLPGLSNPARGDLVTVRPGYAPDQSFLARLADPFYRFVTLANRRTGEQTDWDSVLQIKRVVGLPGDTIRLERFIAYVRPEGGAEFVSEFALSRREYELVTDERPADWQPLDPFGPAGETITLGDDEYFLLSDNRSSAIDSRHWGAVDAQSILAKVSVRFWPLSRFGRP